MHYDLIVIGSGPAGQKAALAAAKEGKKVVVVEKWVCVGGGCVHSGTLPSKSFRESVYRWSLGSRGTLGQESEHAHTAKKGTLPDMVRLLKRRDRVVAGEEKVVEDQLSRNGVQTVHGHARIKGPNEVSVSTQAGIRKLTGEFIFIAVGARPVSPGLLTVDGERILDSNTILDLKELPRSMLVLGAGIIGCEYASMFSMAGTKVYLVDRRHEILASVDREIVSHLTGRFESQKMEIVLEADPIKVERVSGKNAGMRLHLSNGRKLTVDVILVTLGRFGNTDDLGLEGVGIVKNERGLISVDEHYRTNIPSIYAVGDVVGAPALASTSMEQGRIACCHAFGFGDAKMSKLFPYGIYTIPEISMVGPTEEELTAQKVQFVVGRAQYRELARGQIVGDHWGLLKLLVDAKTQKIHGVHVVGDNAADLVHIGQAVMALDGDVQYFIRTVFNYPTLAEGYKTAAFSAINQLRGTTRR